MGVEESPGLLTAEVTRKVCFCSPFIISLGDIQRCAECVDNEGKLQRWRHGFSVKWSWSHNSQNLTALVVSPWDWVCLSCSCLILLPWINHVRFFYSSSLWCCTFCLLGLTDAMTQSDWLFSLPKMSGDNFPLFVLKYLHGCLQSVYKYFTGPKISKFLEVKVISCSLQVAKH